MLLFTKFALFFISINFLCENMGFFTHWLNTALGIILLLCFLMTYFPFKPTIVHKKLLVVGLILFIFGFALLPDDIILRLIGLSFILFGFDLFLRGVNRSAEELPTLLFATAGYLFFIIFYKFNPFLWCWMQTLSLSLTSFMGGKYPIRSYIFGSSCLHIVDFHNPEFISFLT